MVALFGSGTEVERKVGYFSERQRMHANPLAAIATPEPAEVPGFALPPYPAVVGRKREGGAKEGGRGGGGGRRGGKRFSPARWSSLSERGLLEGGGGVDVVEGAEGRGEGPLVWNGGGLAGRDARGGGGVVSVCGTPRPS